MTIKRISDRNGGDYIVIISGEKVFLGHEKKNSDDSWVIIPITWHSQIKKKPERWKQWKRNY